MASSTCDRRRSALVVAVVVLASARTARAEPPTDAPGAKPAAEEKLIEGVELLKARSYREALERFQQAYALVPSPLILYDFGLAYLGLEDDPHALESFDAFLAGAPDAPADKRRKAERYRDELRGRISVVTLEADVGAADLTVDGVGRGLVAFPRRLYLVPGSHAVVARAGASTETTTITCVAGQTLAVSLRLTPPAAPAAVGQMAGEPQPFPIDHLAATEPQRPAGTVDVLPSPPPGKSPSWARPLALSAAAVGVASLGAGLAFGLAARSDGEQVTSESQKRQTFTPSVETSGMRDQSLETVFLAVGAAAVVAGVTIYAWARHRDSGRPPGGEAL